MAPVGDALTFGLRYAAYMAIMPMVLMVGFNLFLGLSPVRLLRQTLRLRLAAAADAIASGRPDTDERLAMLLRSDNAALEKQVAFVRMLHLATPAAAAVVSSMRLPFSGRLAALTPERRKASIPEVAQMMRDAGEIDDDSDLMEFEPRSIRLSIADQAVVRGASKEIATLCRDVYFSQQVLPDLAEALRRIAANLTGGQAAKIPAIPDGPFSDRLHRLQIVAAR